MSEPLIEPLTRREREVLALLSDLNLSNEDIASRLFLSIHSIKWHVRQIYAKLGVTNRRAALSRGNTLGLLGDMAQSASSTLANTKLPVQLSSFIGRRGEIDQILHLLDDPLVRLVTIAGAGGVGKTRLALKVAGLMGVGADFSRQKVSPARPAHQTEGIYLVELAGISEPGRVIEMIMESFGLHLTQNRPPLTLLSETLGTRQVLLVLDNCEHLIEASAHLVLALLKNCPGLRILTTSRAVLDIPGEQVFWLSPLACPTNTAELTPELAGQSEAVCLFVERARAARSGFELTADNFRSVVRICQRLDGLPLALELAAARVRLMNVEQIAERLEYSLNLLAGGSRTALPQHKTMRASIEWSFSLLSPAEQRLLVRLSVFNGEWPLDRAEAVCADDAGEDRLLPRDAVLQTLCGLVDKSLVMRLAAVEPQIYFRLLASISQFAREKLAQSGELALMQRRNLANLLEMPADDPDLNCLIEQLSAISSDWDSTLLTHSERVMQLGLQLAKRAGIHGEELLHFRRGAVLHDIGRLLIPRQVLEKTTALDAEDWEHVRHHPEYSVRILKVCPGFHQILDIPASHHECWDGSGYPRGLSGSDIPLAAQVFAIVNVWDALCSDRPYRRAYSHAQAVAFLRAEADLKMDRQLVKLFLEMIRS